MTKYTLAIASLGALFLLATTGCVHPVYYDTGPPPHAPAHGYRQHHSDVDLVWDAHLGVYAVVGFPSVYFLDGHYYRYGDGVWLLGSGPRGKWKRHRGHLPPGLAKLHHHAKHEHKHKKFKHRTRAFR